MATERKRLLIYTVAYLLCLASAAAAQSHGPAYWVVVASAIAVLVVSATAPALAPAWARHAAVVASALAQLWPPDDFAAAIRTPLGLLPALALALASRVLAADASVRHREFYFARDLAAGAAPRQSILAAVLLALALARLFYGLVDLRPPAGADPALAVVLSAVNGTTIIHRGVVVLFFVICASALDEALLHLADRAAARQALASARDGREALQQALLREGHRSVIRLIADALDRPRAAPRAGEDTLATLAFERASRRFVRNLVPLLPLLGLLGTVIGLARALGDLKLAPNGAGVADFTGVLSGLAIKFETTLLGLVTSMLASVLLSLMEKRETEFSAQCVLSALQLSHNDQRLA